MTYRLSTRAVAVLGVCCAVALCGPTAWGAEGLQVAVLTGGHGFSEKPFLAMFDGHDGITFVHVPLEDDSEVFEDISDWLYDAIVLYNMTQKISDRRRENFLTLLDKGVGLVVLHHAIAAYSGWPEYAKIIGAKYYLEDTVEDGVTHPACTYKHDVDFRIRVEDAGHPVTQGLTDFTVHDETYKGSSFASDNHVVLTTDSEISDTAVAWVRTYRNANVYYMQMGHGDTIFADANYRRLLVQAVRWAAQGKANQKDE